MGLKQAPPKFAKKNGEIYIPWRAEKEVRHCKEGKCDGYKERKLIGIVVLGVVVDVMKRRYRREATNNGKDLYEVPTARLKFGRFGGSRCFLKSRAHLYSIRKLT